MNKKRLLKVAQALRESPAPKKFRMDNFAHSCGTPACALGHYAARRDLQRTFKLVIEEDDMNWVTTEDGKTWYDEQPVLDHFGLTKDEAFELFGGVGCGNAQTAKQAARYIERFVARKS